MSYLTNQERIELRQILEKHFGLGELKTLAFDMGINYQNFPNLLDEFAREFFLYFERQNRLSYLVSEIIKRRPQLDLSNILAKLPPSMPNVKMQIILPESDLQTANKLLEDLAEELGYLPEQVQIVGAAWGSMRLLISSQKAVAELLLDLSNRSSEPVSISKLSLPKRKMWAFMYRNHLDWDAFTSFSELDTSSQEAWHSVVELTYLLNQHSKKSSNSNFLTAHYPLIAWGAVIMAYIPQFISPVELYDLMKSHFTNEELKIISYKLGLSEKKLLTMRQNSRIMQLIHYVETQGRFHELINAAMEIRPELFSEK